MAPAQEFEHTRAKRQVPQAVAEQVPDALRCDVELRRFLTEVSHQAITADDDSAGVSYVQSQHNLGTCVSPDGAGQPAKQVSIQTA